MREICADYFGRSHASRTRCLHSSIGRDGGGEEHRCDGLYRKSVGCGARQQGISRDPRSDQEEHEHEEKIADRPGGGEPVIPSPARVGLCDGRIVMNVAKTMMLTVLVISMTMLAWTSHTEKSLIPKEMVYVGHGPSMMGMDKGEPAELGGKLTAYDRRMKTPWLAEALNDEGPVHMVFLDSYLIDMYEVSNKDYGDFIRKKEHPAPAYWDDPHLNKPEQPVVGVNWEEAKTFCEYRGKRLPTEAEWEKAARGPKANLYPWGNDFDPAKVNYGKNHDATMPVNSYPEGASYYGLFN